MLENRTWASQYKKKSSRWASRRKKTHPSESLGESVLKNPRKDQAQTPALRPPQRPCAAVPLSVAELREVPIVELFGLVHEEDFTVEGVRKAYRRLTLMYHPDKGADADAFNELTQRYEEACFDNLQDFQGFKSS